MTSQECDCNTIGLAPRLRTIGIETDLLAVDARLDLQAHAQIKQCVLAPAKIGPREIEP